MIKFILKQKRILIFCVPLVFALGTIHAETQTQLSVTIYPMPLNVLIVDQNKKEVESPNVPFDPLIFNFIHQSTTGILGTGDEQIFVANLTSVQPWTVNMAAKYGPETLWSDIPLGYGDDCTNACMDYNNGTGIGQLTVDPSTGQVIREDYGDTDGIILGTKTAFVQGYKNSVMLFRSSSAEAYHGYSLTGVTLTQTVPAEQLPRGYTLDMAITIV